MHTSILCSLVLIAVIALIDQTSAAGTFTVDYDKQTFLKDGKPFRYISGTLHYFQIPRALWRDRMLRVRALGCNVLQTYVLWSLHQPTERTFNFAADANLTEYLTLAQQLGFSVILRIGPFINAEMDFGGFPYWLLKNKDVVLRSSKDQRYLQAVQTWMAQLLPNVKPLLYQNGGPIIMVQIENEYGYNFPDCDGQYMLWLRDLTRQYLGQDIVLFTTDGGYDPRLLQCAQVPPGVLPTIDFGSTSEKNVSQYFGVLRQFLPRGPLVNSEFYPGWLDHWGNNKHASVPSVDVTNTMRYIWNLNITSLSIYPAHGGSNWGYSAGSNTGLPQASYFQGVTTGYDFDAPISEAGDITGKYVDIRNTIQQLVGTQLQDPVPDSPIKYSYGRLRMEWLGTVLDLLGTLVDTSRIVHSIYPLTMEEVDQAYGFVLYETTIPQATGRLQINGVRDRAYVMIDGQLASVIQRQGSQTKGNIIQLSKFKNLTNSGSKLQILVENQGRLCFSYGGPFATDPKGLIENATLNDQILTTWTMYPIDLGRIYQVTLSKNKAQQMMAQNRQNNKPMDQAKKYIPSVYYGYFFAEPKPGDTFFNPNGWGKGQLYVNGNNIGRYWPQAGPQITVYVPGTYLTSSDYFNQIYVLELDQPGECETEEKYGCWAEFQNQPKYVN